MEYTTIRQCGEILTRMKDGQADVIGISGPPLSGKSGIVSRMSGVTQVITIPVDLMGELDIVDAGNKILERMAYEDGSGASRISDAGMFGNAIMTAANNSGSKKPIILVFDNFGDLPQDFQYVLASNLRNIRELSRAKSENRRIHSVFLGTWSALSMAELCHKHVGSYPCSDYWLTDCPAAESHGLVYDIPEFGEQGQSPYIVDYLWQITGGCCGLMEHIVGELEPPLTIEKIKKVASSVTIAPWFISTCLTEMQKLSPKAVSSIVKLLNGRLLPFNPIIHLDKNDEELLMSGLVHFTTKYGVTFMDLRSWIHEVVLRTTPMARKVFGNEFVYSDVEEIIPPTPALNRYGYEIVMDVENALRNLIIKRLAMVAPPGSHPLQITNRLGKVKRDAKGECFTVFEDLERRKRTTESREYIDAHSALSTQMQVGDLIDLLANGYLVNDRKQGINEYFTGIIEPKDWELLKKWSNIRHVIAHNNPIAESTATELITIAKTIFKRFVEQQ